MAEKMTKTMWYEAIKEVVDGADVEDKVEMMEFIDKQIQALASSAERARKRAEKAKQEGDSLRELVYDCVTAELTTIDDITEKVSELDETVTKSKVTARLSQLYKAGKVEKAQVKNEDGRKVMAYMRVDTDIPVSMTVDPTLDHAMHPTPTNLTSDLWN